MVKQGTETLRKPSVLSVTETAFELNISVSLVRKLIKDGRIQALRIGERRLVVPTRVIDQILESGLN